MDLMVLKYFEELEVKDISGSKAVLLTKPFNMMGINSGEKVSVKLEDNRLTIKKVVSDGNRRKQI